MTWAIGVISALAVWLVIEEVSIWLGLQHWVLMDRGGRFLTSSGAWSSDLSRASVYRSRDHALQLGRGTPVRLTKALLTPTAPGGTTGSH